MEEKHAQQEQKKFKKWPVLVLVLFLILILGGSFAWLLVNLNSEKVNVIKAGNLSLELDDTTTDGISLENAIPMSYNQGMTTQEYTFTLKNESTVISDYTIYLDDVTTFENDEGKTVTITDENRLGDNSIRFILLKNGEEPTAEKSMLLSQDPGRIIDMGTINPETTITYSLRVWINSQAVNDEVMGKLFNAKLRVEAIQSSINQKKENIVSAYTYNSSTCVTGLEDTCEKTDCYKNKVEGSCPAGTIVDYKVNDTDTVRFHVMYDNGSTLTMQSQKNTISHTPWIDAADYASENTDETSCDYPSCTDEGPMTVLVALEQTTKGWTNVNDQTYTMGTTSLSSKGEFTRCSTYNTCTTNRYTLDSRTEKARMITVQEAANLGCTNFSKSCPVWMYNYLYDSTSYGGTVNDTSTDPTTGSINDEYWTMNAYSSSVYSVWSVRFTGYMSTSTTSETGNGARAVVEVSK